MSTQETTNRIAPEFKWAAGLIPPLVIALFTADAYLRRATIALAIQTPPDILGEVVAPRPGPRGRSSMWALC